MTFNIAVTNVRKRVFTDEFMEVQFQRVGGQNLGKDTPTPKLGYPDMGAGFIAKGLPYKQWFEFNCYQRIHNNSIEHLSWLMPLTLVGGIFFPRFTVGCTSTVLVGRELYRRGYLSKDGPNSFVRELGAIPLNVAELLLVLSLGVVWLKYKTGAFFLRRKFIRRFTWTHYDRRLEELEKEAEKAKNSWTPEESLGPMHPKIMMQVMANRQDHELKALVGHTEPDL
jgi:hypothetical protein